MLSRFEYLHWRTCSVSAFCDFYLLFVLILAALFVDVPFSLVIFYLILISVYASYRRSYCSWGCHRPLCKLFAPGSAIVGGSVEDGHISVYMYPVYSSSSLCVICSSSI